MMKRLMIKVIPKSSQNRVIGEESDALGNKILKIKTTVAPENNQANKAVIAILSRYLKVSKSKISIVSGQTSRMKIVEVDITQ